MSMSEIFKARFASVNLSGEPALAWQDAMSTSAAFWDWVGPLLPVAEKHSIPGDIFAVLDDVADHLTDPESEVDITVVETAVEELRLTCVGAIPVDRLAYIDGRIDIVAIEAGESITISYPSGAGSPYTLSEFCRWRWALRRCFGIPQQAGVYNVPE